MHLKRALPILFASVGAVVAQNTTTSLLLLGMNQEPIVGSIIRSDATATTYSLGCEDLEKCNLKSSFTFTQGPSTVQLEAEALELYGGYTTYAIACVITTDHGSCSRSLGGGSRSGNVYSGTLTVEDYLAYLHAVTITAGPAATRSASVTTTTAKDGEGALTTEVSSASNPSNSSTASAISDGEGSSTTRDASSPSSTGGAPRITNGPWFAGGVAAALAFAAM